MKLLHHRILLIFNLPAIRQLAWLLVFNTSLWFMPLK